MSKKIRFREVVSRKPQYGRYPEWQVVDGKTRKIIGRFDLLRQAQAKHPDAVVDALARVALASRESGS